MSNISLNYAQIIDPLSFKSINLAKIYIGEYGTLPNPANSATWKQAYFVNSDGTRTAASQPIRTNAAGYAVDGSGNIKTIQVDGGYSLLVQDQLSVTKFSQACSAANSGAVLEFDTIAGFTGALDGSVCYFKGRDTIGDGGGGPLRFLAGSTATANGVTIYAVTGGRLVREGWSVFGINVKWAGAKGDGVTDDTAAVSAFLAAIVDKTGRVPRGTYKLTQPMTLTGSSTALICEPGTIFDFHLPDHASDCFTLSPAGYEPLVVENLTINCNNTGRDGLAFSKGAPKMRNIVINQPYRDGIGVTVNSSNSSWVENWTCDGTLLITAAGRHALHATLTGAWNGTPFFNETLLEQFEVRGIGRNFAHASAIRFTFDGTTAAPVSGFTVLQCNFDAQVASAVAPVSHTIYAQSLNGGVGSMESLYIKGGGWESTSAVAPGGLYNYNADASVSTKLSCIVGVVNYNWAYNVCPAYALEKSNYYADANGAHYASALQKSDGYAFKAASGGYLGGFTNNPTAYRTRSFLVASGNATVDIPIGAMSDYSAQAPLVVTIFHKGFYDSLGFYGYGVYLVSPSRTNVDYVHSVVMLSGSSNDAYSFTPAAVTFSIPSSGTLRVTIPGGASVGTSGTSTAFDIAANRMFVDLPGVVTGLTL